MSYKMLIEFAHHDVMKARPWPVAIDKDDTVTSGLGRDDGAGLLGFQEQGVQRVTVTIEEVMEDPGLAVGLYPVFANGGVFAWALPIRSVTVRHFTPITEAEFKLVYEGWEGDAEYHGKHQVIVEDWHDVTETPSECIMRLNSEVIAISKQVRAQHSITTSQILNAYDDFQGEDVGIFTTIWDVYLRGEMEPCKDAADGIHQITSGSCDICGGKNFA